MWLRAVTFPLAAAAAAAAVVPRLVAAAAVAISAPSLKKAGDEFAVVRGVIRREVYFQMQWQSQATTCIPSSPSPPAAARYLLGVVPIFLPGDILSWRRGVQPRPTVT